MISDQALERDREELFKPWPKDCYGRFGLMLKVRRTFAPTDADRPDLIQGILLQFLGLSRGHEHSR